MALNQSGHQNWLRVIQYLMHLVDMKCDFSKNELENKKLAKIFKQKIENIYQNWWNEKMKSTENRKLDFFFSLTYLVEKHGIFPCNHYIFTQK